jgi:hypothetical protein
MFTPEERAQLRSDLLEFASTDKRISGAAITGSAAEDREDCWSDIDLAFGVNDGVELSDLLADWTKHMYDNYRALHHLDVRFGAWNYRVFLLPGTLQVDLAFVTRKQFRALSPAFRLVFGEAREPQQIPTQAAGDLIGFGWLYALHARSCIARRRFWQAEHMINGVRNNALTMACIRYGLPAAHGRGIDQLPSNITTPLLAAFVRELNAAELDRAFSVALEGLLAEIRHVDRELAERLREAFGILSGTIS